MADLKKIKSKIFSSYARTVGFTLLLLFYIFGWVVSLFFPKKLKSKIFFKFGKISQWFIFKLCFIKINTVNMDKIPRRGLIFTANHRSLLDDLALILLLDRYFFVLTAPLDRFPWILQIWVTALGYIPTFVDKKCEKKFKIGKTKKEAMDEAVLRLKNNESMLIFPEGKLERGKGIQEFHTGAVRLALKSKVPILPVGIVGSDKNITPIKGYFHKGSARIVFGKAIDYKRYYGKVNDRKVVKKLTKELQEKVIKLSKRRG